MDTDSEQTDLSSPNPGSESRGSSVSSALREEYEDLLRYAVITPVVDLSGRKGASQQTTRIQHPPSPAPVPQPRPHSPHKPIQPQVSKVLSDISDPSDLQLPSDHPLPHPPPPFTTMSVQHQEMTQPIRLHDQSTVRSHGTQPQSHDESIQSHDEYIQSHDQSGVRSHDQSGVRSHDQSTVRSHDVDPEKVRLESQLDGWCLDLKRNIMAEFEQGRLRVLARREAEHQRERQQCTQELGEAHAQLEQHKELLVTYEQSIRRKDHVITNLTSVLQKQKDRIELQRSFGLWKLRHCDEKREMFTATLAQKYHQHKVKGRVWRAWFGVIQSRWRQRLEKACQCKAEEVCVQLTGEYEQQLEDMRRSLEEYQANVVRLKAERDLYEENMKKAFMRGVCALNMEAMSMFRYQDNGDGSYSNAPSNHGDADNIPEENIQAHREENEATASILNPPARALSVNNQPTKTVHSCAPGSHVTRPPGHVTRAPGHVTRAPGHVTRAPGHVTRAPGHVTRTAKRGITRPTVIVHKH